MFEFQRHLEWIITDCVIFFILSIVFTRLPAWIRPHLLGLIGDGVNTSHPDSLIFLFVNAKYPGLIIFILLTARRLVGLEFSCTLWYISSMLTPLHAYSFMFYDMLVWGFWWNNAGISWRLFWAYEKIIWILLIHHLLCYKEMPSRSFWRRDANEICVLILSSHIISAATVIRPFPSTFSQINALSSVTYPLITPGFFLSFTQYHIPLFHVFLWFFKVYISLGNETWFPFHVMLKLKLNR